MRVRAPILPPLVETAPAPDDRTGMLTRRTFGILVGTLAATAITGRASAASPRKVPGAAEVWADLLRGNRRFVEGALRPRSVAAVRRELARGQHPRAIVVGCADSRVSPELVFDQSLGDLFVVRTA